MGSASSGAPVTLFAGAGSPPRSPRTGRRRTDAPLTDGRIAGRLSAQGRSPPNPGRASELDAVAPCLRQPDGYGLLPRSDAPASLPHAPHLLPDEFTRLGCWLLALACVAPCIPYCGPSGHGMNGLGGLQGAVPRPACARTALTNPVTNGIARMCALPVPTRRIRTEESPCPRWAGGSPRPKAPSRPGANASNRGLPGGLRPPISPWPAPISSRWLWLYPVYSCELDHSSTHGQFVPRM